ncbi:achaete-scute homolog 5-like [Tubulanus polymorphus]|uniref:achaete-scute homolog 5-like n=1 Tax=Tubulanus polymorphus TaxID=672921 RepID=UPI003DA2AFC0
MEYDHLTGIDLHNRITSPTCEDLGIPSEPNDPNIVPAPYYPQGPPFRFAPHQMKMEPAGDPFSPYCQIPLPHPFGSYDYGVEPAFIRKRNERERERVRCVNEGYARLREHIPLDNKDKRISKVETLRAAIKYIKHMQTLLADKPSKKRPLDTVNDGENRPKRKALRQKGEENK